MITGIRIKDRILPFTPIMLQKYAYFNVKAKYHFKINSKLTQV